jgi:hypothetical protein
MKEAAGLIASVAGTLSAQLVLGRLLFAVAAWAASLRRPRRRRPLVLWTVAARALRRASPFALAALVGSVALGRAVGLDRPLVWHSPIAFLAVGAWPTSSCYLLVHAAWRESRGAVRSARRDLRFAGQSLFAGTLLLLVVVWWDLIMQPAFRRAMLAESGTTGIVLLVAMVGMGTGAFLAAVAGLAGKPRPSAFVSGLLYAAGLAGIVVAVGLAGRGAVRVF